MPRRAPLFSLLALLLAGLIYAGAAPGFLGSLPFFEASALVGTASFQHAPARLEQEVVPEPGSTGVAPSDSSAAPDAPAALPVPVVPDRLPKRFHAARRQAVLEALPEGAVAVLFSSPQRTRTNDIHHEYRQDSNLYYLTGTSEAASVLMLAPDGLKIDGETVQEVLFVPPRTPSTDVWLGPRLGPERAEDYTGVEIALSNERFAGVLEQQAAQGRRFFHLPLPYGIEEDTELARQVTIFREVSQLLPGPGSPLAQRAAEVMHSVDRPEAFQTFQQQFRTRLSADAFRTRFLREAYRQFIRAGSLADWDRWRSEHLGVSRADGQALTHLLTRMRERKRPEEQRLLKRAATITAAAQRAALRAVAPDLHEYEVEALAEYVFHKHGAEAPAFPSLVGSGPHTAVLQYHHNRRRMRAGDLVVIDIGAEYHGYAADVTRTVPVDGTFSEEQRAIYELVLRAQQAAIRAARPGNNFRDPHQVARRVLGEGLVKLGLIDDPNEVSRYFPHPAAHHLGLDVHDAGRGGPLAAGMVLAIEPGLYLRPSEDLPPKWHGIGVRIEDVVLVTPDGPVILSKEAPREVDALEALMREPGTGAATEQP